MNLLSFHNLHLMQELVAGARAAITDGAFAGFYESWQGAGAPRQ